MQHADAMRRVLTAWVDARDRCHEAAEKLAELNVRSGYDRPDGAPELSAWHAARLLEARAADELYQLAKQEL